MIDEQSSASGHDYASNRSAIEAGLFMYVCVRIFSFKPISKVVQYVKDHILE